MSERDDDEDDGEGAGEECRRCAGRGEALVERGELSERLAPGVVGAMPPALIEALGRCVRCLRHDGVTIDRAHVERVHEALGAIAEPLPAWLAERARRARPELEGAPLLVSDGEAVLIAPAEIARQRLEALVRVDAPRTLIEDMREAVAEAERRQVRLEWERVDAWPAPGRYPGTVGFGEIARTLAELAIPPLVGAGEQEEILGAISWAIARLVLDEDGLEYRHQLAAAARTEEDPRRARGLALAVRFLDELGHTDLRDNQDTLIDDCHAALAAHASAEAARVYVAWLEVGVPRAWARIAAAR